MKNFTYTLLLLPFLGYANLELVKDARAQVGVTNSYDGTYTKINYPMGDVPEHTGVCTDVVIRAFRQQGTDLQKKIHEDMKNLGAVPDNIKKCYRGTDETESIKQG